MDNSALPESCLHLFTLSLLSMFKENKCYDRTSQSEATGKFIGHRAWWLVRSAIATPALSIALEMRVRIIEK
jgi:hypothetical protein